MQSKAVEAVITGLCRIGGYPVAIAVFEFNFLGGSMASVVGEKLTRTIELAMSSQDWGTINRYAAREVLLI